MNDWGVPDWTDEQAYPKKLHMLQWWWEFTRRRPDYRALWLAHEPRHKRTVEINKDAADKTTSTDQNLHLLHTVTSEDPIALRLTFGLSWLLDPGVIFSLHYLKIVHASHQVMVQDNKSRALEGAKTLIEVSGGEIDFDMLDRMTSIYKRPEELEQEKGLVRYLFDLSKPLNPQLKEAAVQLRAEQEGVLGRKNTAKPNRQNWPDYLRVLDGRDANATHLAVGKEVWPNVPNPKKRAEEAEKAGKRVRDNFPI